jgi:autotransporter-associated beta strand protein
MDSFTGTILVPGNTTFRFNSGGGNTSFGSINATFDLGIGTATLQCRNAGTMNLGALKGGAGTFVTGQGSGSGTLVWSIGNNGLSTTFNGTINDATTARLTAITKVGTGTLTLTGPNTYTGATTISGGILQIGDGVTSGAGQLGTANVTDNATLAFARPDAISVANIISGSGNLVQAGGNVLTLASANSYRGATIMTNGGTVLVGAVSAIPATTALTLGGAGTAGTLDMAGNDVQVSALNTGSGAAGGTVGSSGGSNPTTFTVNATNGSSAFSGVIQNTLPSGGSGVIALTVQNGKLTLTGANTYSGTTTISNGTLVLGAGGSISSSTSLVLATAASTLDASVSGLSLPSGYSLSGVGVVTGAVTAASSLINPATNGTVGTLSFSNSLALTGGVTVHFDLSALPASGNDQIVVGGALNLSGLNTIEISPLTSLGEGTYRLFSCDSVSGTTNNLQLVGSLGIGLGASLRVTGTEVDLVVIVTATSFIWNGDGTLNHWDYTTANWRSNGVASLFADNSFVLFDDTGSNTPAIDIAAPVAPAKVTVNASINYTLGSIGGSGKITGIGSLTKTNSGTLTLLTPNDYLGGTVIKQGTVQIGDGSTPGATLGNGDVANNGSLVFNQPDNYDFTNIISGTGNFTQQGSSTLTLSGNNTFKGTTTISTGTLQVGNGSVSGTLGTNTVLNSSSLVFNRSDSVTQTGLITGNGTLTVQAGTLVVTASNSFSGGTTINGGSTLQLGNGGTTGSVPPNITDNGTLAFDHSANETNGNVITGSGGISKLGGNTLTLTAANNYNGDTAIPAGTLKVGTAGTIPNGSGFGNIVLDAGASTAGTFDMNGFDVTINGITGTSNSVLGQIVNNNSSVTNVLSVGNGDATTTYRGTIKDNNNGTSGKVALTKIGAGTITLAETNGYTGGTVIINGVLALGSNHANNSGGFSGVGPTNIPVVFNGGTLQLFGYNGSTSPNYNSFYNPLVVPVGQSGTLQLFSRGPATGNPGLGSPLTGGGTLNLVVNYVRDSLDGDWSAFTGIINVTAKPAGNDEFRINNRFGYANAAIFLNDGVTMDRASGANPTNDIGELGGTSGAFLRAGNSSSGSPTWRVGWKNTSATFAGTIQNDGTTSIIKVGSGTWTLTGANTYAGSTTISNGVLALGDGVTDGSIGNSTTIYVVSGAVLDVSGRSDGTLTLNASQNLMGNGTVRGSVTASSGSTVSPGASIGLLTITNALTLQSGSVTAMEVDATAGTNDVIVAQGSVAYGGTLQIKLVNGTLAAGQIYKLFNAPSGQYSGSFDGGVSPASTNGLTWDTSKLTVDGTLKVIVATKPVIGNISISGSDLSFSGNNGIPNASFNLLSSTDVTLPLSSWTVVGAYTFDGSGNFSFTLSGAFDPNQPQVFYSVQY